MDMSWCIICDRRCEESMLYCSTVCRDSDANNQTIQHYPSQPTVGSNMPSFVWTPTFHRSYSFRTQASSGGQRLNSVISSSNSITVI
ncbi:hypothetical protein BGW37DRAFT_493240 [Umbelopsis sp. PMI_123]|nr:hypothetical protein BGW37DRAFT_493240 [Umbelopsis sp. PMI_123]